MYSYGPPWKLAVIGTVAVIAGVALLLMDWTLPQLTAFVAMFFVGRGALHVVTMSFEGVPGALSALLGYGEIGVGVLLLVWPSPTLLVVVVVVGVLVLVRSVVDATVVLATRAERMHWRLRLGAAVVELALGVTLIARPAGSLHGTAMTLGVLAVFDGVVEIAEAVARKHHEPRVPVSVPARSHAAGMTSHLD
jgi:uncharacterized membrane protein HdeD (DUF308 family)